MAKGSAAYGILGALAGVLLALLAIFIGSTSARLSSGAAESQAAHGDR